MSIEAHFCGVTLGPPAPVYAPNTPSYLGRKDLVAPKILKAMKARWGDDVLATQTLVDAFAGSCAFSLTCCNAFAEVRINDWSKSSCAWAHAIFTRPRLSMPWPPAQAFRNVALDGPRGSEFITREFCTFPRGSAHVIKGVTVHDMSGPRYFKPSNGAVIDYYRNAFRAALHNGRIGEAEYYFDVGSLLLACNEVRNCETSYESSVQEMDGKKTDINKYFYRMENGKRVVKSLDLITTQYPEEGVFLTRATHDIVVRPIRRGDFPDADEYLASGKPLTITSGDALAAASAAPEESVLYLDPPYNDRKYASHFHVPDVIADPGPNPTIKQNDGAHSLEYTKSDWETKGKPSKDAFEAILSQTPAKKLVLSYMDTGLVNYEDLCGILSRTGWDAENLVRLNSGHGDGGRTGGDYFVLIDRREDGEPEPEPPRALTPPRGRGKRTRGTQART
jgi:D12 class N6 adenine-specific DNA methyltransferase